ncbi:class II aldolase [Rhodospirillum rubrum]|uniref:bifunctional 5-methylthioribulose-1-phosphate/5-deoxyribulose-1- phosphate aldolase n=1 Tax=Rhodospirillum rubrum TaxID=1085 RepID=UPI001906B191|nr:bifunctional 5-methylthioribulose-1-phosphate/5-deoxyribulose-1-phosphate aldolase [Rhodospirillum rubrum]MBK1663718.1 class II aldolase [Rhodospirillum rubrum]MBK1676469.1 class II aldolase [Rhodospirillum rubrum]
MPGSRIALRHGLIDAARQLTTLGLNKGTAGNLSVRAEDGLLITPSGLQAADLRPHDIVFIDGEGEWRGPRKPSSEWRFHHDIMAERPDVGAVVHTHAPFSTVLACLGRPIPAFHYMVAMAGGSDIRIGAYATFGTAELSRHALAAMEGRKACLLAHHGMIATGPTLKAAIKLAVEVEELAEQYWRCLQIAEPEVLPADEMERVLEKFKTYGDNAQLPSPPA